MPTLAQQFLMKDMDFSFTENERFKKLQDWTTNFIRRGLTMPTTGADALNSAERYVFEESPPQIIQNLIGSKSLDPALLREMFRWPATNFWIEYPAASTDGIPLTIGSMVGKAAMSNGKIVTMLAVVMQDPSRNKILPTGLIILPDDVEAYQDPQKTFIKVYWFMGYFAEDNDEKLYGPKTEAYENSLLAVKDLIDCLFLINTPRVGEMRPSTFGSPAKRKAKHHDGGVPLTEYKRIILHVGKGSPNYKSDPTRAASGNEYYIGKRLHRVVGHFRTYREGREQPMVSFVPQHWRGDAELGILLHERLVKP